MDKIPSNLNELLLKLEQFKTLGNKEFTTFNKNNESLLNKKAVSYYKLGINCFNDNFEKLKQDNGQDGKDSQIIIIGQILKCISLVYSNLSLCYINGIEIENALQSSLLGVQYDSTNSKCHYRKSLCYQYMCNYKDALSSIQDALRTNITDNSLKSLIENEKIEIEKKLTKQHMEEKECNDRINVDNQQFQQFPIELVWRDGFGRCILASEDIPKGTMVLRVSPFASVLEDHKIYKNCGFCFKKVDKSSRQECLCKSCENYILCTNCSKDPYAVSYHKEECDILEFLKKYYPASSTRDFRFMFRVLLNVVKDRQTTTPSTSSTTSAQFTKDNQSKNWLDSGVPFIFDEFKYLINLSRTLDKVESNQMDAFKRSSQSVIAVFDQLRGSDFIKNSGITQSEIIEIYSIVLSNGHEMLHPLNCHTYGLGIFPTGSYLNHSCLPNAFWYNDDQGMMVFRTLRNLKKGDEILTSYTDITTEYHERRNHLLKQYFFYCQCNQCKYQSTLTDQQCSTCKKQLSKSSLSYTIPLPKSFIYGFQLTCENGHLNNEIDKINPMSYFSASHDQKTFKKVNCLLEIIHNRHSKIANDGNGNQQQDGEEYIFKNMPDYMVYKEITLALENSMVGNPSKINSDQVFTNSLIQYYYRLFISLKIDKPNDKLQLQSIKSKILKLLTPIIHLPSSHHKKSIEKKLLL